MQTGSGLELAAVSPERVDIYSVTHSESLTDQHSDLGAFLSTKSQLRSVSREVSPYSASWDCSLTCRTEPVMVPRQVPTPTQRSCHWDKPRLCLPHDVRSLRGCRGQQGRVLSPGLGGSAVLGVISDLKLPHEAQLLLGLAWNQASKKLPKRPWKGYQPGETHTRLFWRKQPSVVSLQYGLSGRRLLLLR